MCLRRVHHRQIQPQSFRSVQRTPVAQAVHSGGSEHAPCPAAVCAEAYNPDEDEDEDAEPRVVNPKTDEQRRRLQDACKHILLFKTLEQVGRQPCRWCGGGGAAGRQRLAHQPTHHVAFFRSSSLRFWTPCLRYWSNLSSTSLTRETTETISM